ncbi:MAG: homocysteine S-methyltransferase family protein [Alphaproteobacteria bacterium]
MTTLQERIERKDVIILDGAMGTELQRRGVPMHHVAWSGEAVLTHPEAIREVHEDYIGAGADVIITNTFSTARHVLGPAGLGDKVAEANRRAVALAKEARDKAAGDRPVWIAGSISSFIAGLDPENMPGPDEFKANYREQAKLLAEAGVDLIVLEMMSDVEQSTIAVEAAGATGLPTWVGFSCSIGPDGATLILRGEDGVERPFEVALGAVMAAGGSLAAVMHTEVETTRPALEIVFDHWSGPVAAYPHSGDFVMPNWQFVDIIAPEDFVAEAQRWVEMGVRVVGGCCGTGPEHIRLLKERLPSRIPAAGSS